METLRLASLSTYYLIVTNCTARKRRAQDSLRLGCEMVEQTLEGTARRWRSALAAHGARLRAHDLYIGRSMSDAKQVATTLDGRLYVASAGLGLVSTDEHVAPYDLTASGSQGGLQEVLERFETTSRQWWNLMCHGRGLTHLLAQHPEAVLLAALPANYVEMVAGDLCDSPAIALQRVKLFTSQVGATELPSELAGMVMPYDDRLESIAGYAGTRADFPQRAMRHFVEQLGACGLDQAQARIAVQEALSLHQLRCSVERKRADDDTIRALIREQWRATGGRGSVLLRYLRDESRTACEQGRFARLWREVRAEMGQSRFERVA